LGGQNDAAAMRQFPPAVSVNAFVVDDVFFVRDMISVTPAAVAAAASDKGSNPQH